MVKLLTWVLVGLCLLSTGACQKDVLTEGEKTSQTIQTIIRDKNITKANLYLGNSAAQYDVPFAIEGQFLIFRNSSPNQYYNLAKLTRFDIAPNVGGGPLTIQFYF